MAKRKQPTFAGDTPQGAFIELAKNPEDGKWYWLLWSQNGRQMATSAIGYPRRNDAGQAIASAVEIMASNPKVVIGLGKNDAE